MPSGLCRKLLIQLVLPRYTFASRSAITSKKR
jgi:hypothetical protein